MFNELTSGIEYYWFISGLAAKLDSNATQISEKLIKTASLLFTKGNLTAAITCGTDDLPIVVQEFPAFAKTLPTAQTMLVPWKFIFEKKNEGFLTASKVQYVFKGYNFKLLGYDWNGTMRVLNQILSSDWLQNQVRVIGGAYGGFSSIVSNGQVMFSSYRDPNLKETLTNYDAIPKYLVQLDVNDKEMTRYILGTIADLDNPLTPSQKGDVAVRYYLEKKYSADLQKERDEVINVTLDDIKAMKKMISDILNQNVICVYGNEDKIQAQKDLFGKIQKLSR
jgi:Zn-dependent M16 (insulinase) family peptidase